MSYRRNIFKTALLFVLFLIFVVGLGWALSYHFGNGIWFYFSLTVGLLMIWAAYFRADSLILALSDARAVSKGNAPVIFEIAKDLAQKEKIPEPQIYVIENEPALNAFSVGRNLRHSSVVMTRGMLNKFAPEEIEGVLAHEFSHMKNLDTLLGSSIFVLTGFAALPYDLLLKSVAWKGIEDRERNSVPTRLALFLAAAILSFFAMLAVFVIQLFIPKSRQFAADAEGLSLSRAGGFKSALLKIAADQNSLRAAGSSTAHLWIDDPYKGDEKRVWFYKYLNTYPPIEKRIKSIGGDAPR